MSVAEFNELTPRELWLIVEAHNERLRLEQEAMLSHAYTTARLHRAQKLPSFKEILEAARSNTRQVQQTPQQMLAAVKAMNAFFGGETVYKS